MATATPPGQAREGPATAAQSGLIRGLYADRAVPWPARTSHETFLMERATAGSGQFLTEPDAGQVTGWLPRRVTPGGHPDPPGESPDMTPAALLARLTSRGYIPVSHGATDYPENWLGLDGPAGSVRVVTHPGDGERAEVDGLGPAPAGPLVFEVHMPGGTPEAVTVAMLNAAEAWLGRPATAMTPAIQRAAGGLPPGGSRPATAPPREDMP
jgi:hypothetical protein